MQARKGQHGAKGAKRNVVRPSKTAKKPGVPRGPQKLKAAPTSERVSKMRKELARLEGRANADQIMALASTVAGSNAKAQDWYRTFPIPAFGGVTAEFLVDHGRAKEVRDYLNSVVLGEFA